MSSRKASTRQKRVRKRVFAAILVFFLVIFGIGIVKFGRYFPALWDLFFKKEIQLKETKEKRVNILILGVGGGTHEGPDLTDTMIFASIDPEKKNVTLVSIPRDLWIPELKAKINTAYTYGEAKQKGNGLVLTKATVVKLLGQQVDYAIKIDFNGFIKAVDMVGGLDIDVDHTFDDYQYPVTGEEDNPCGHTEIEVASLSAQLATGSASELDSFPCRYEHIHYDKGPNQMDGKTALKYVRSRHALGVEGSDFARSKRQEKVITSFKEKAFSLGIILNPVKAFGLISTVKDSIDTDIKDDEYDDFVKLAQKMRGASIKSTTLDIGDVQEGRLGLLDSPRPSEEYGKQWVLAPRTGNGNFSEIHSFINCEINLRNCIVGEFGITTPTPEVTTGIKRK